MDDVMLWLNRMICPDCQGRIYVNDNKALFCDKCGRVFHERDGILDLLCIVKDKFPMIEERDLIRFTDIKIVYEQAQQYHGAEKLIAEWSLTKIEKVNYKLIQPYLKGKKVLEIGCGRGYLTNMISKITPTVAFDISRDNIKFANNLGNLNNAFYFQGNVYSMPFKSNTFDIVVISEVLEHLSNPNIAIAEIRRVLNGGGLVIASVPNTLMYFYPVILAFMCIHKRERNHLIGLIRREVDESPEQYHRPFLPWQFKSLFEENGFKVIQHKTSMYRYWRFPYDRIILWGDKHCSRMTKWVVNIIIKLTDLPLDKEVPVIKWFGTRQHILVRKT